MLLSFLEFPDLNLEIAPVDSKQLSYEDRAFESFWMSLSTFSTPHKYLPTWSFKMRCSSVLASSRVPSEVHEVMFSVMLRQDSHRLAANAGTVTAISARGEGSAWMLPLKFSITFTLSCHLLKKRPSHLWGFGRHDVLVHGRHRAPALCVVPGHNIFPHVFDGCLPNGKMTWKREYWQLIKLYNWNVVWWKTLMTPTWKSFLWFCCRIADSSYLLGFAVKQDIRH